MHNIIDRAVTTQDGPQNIVADALNLAFQPALCQLISVTYVKRVIRRARKRKVEMSANPLSLQDLVIPDEFTKTLKSQDFVLYDSGQARSQHWYADGTFETVLPLFVPLYTIHGLINNNIVPAGVFFFGKREESYRMVFSKPKQLEPSMRPISHEFIGIQLRGSFFLHICQCLYRKIQSNDFAMLMRHLPSLACVPVEDVVLAFKELLSRVDFPLESQPVPDYFEDTCIGRPTGGNKRRPTTYTTLNECGVATTILTMILTGDQYVPRAIVIASNYLRAIDRRAIDRIPQGLSVVLRKKIVDP
ncbi:hypothetical protein ACJMK2_038469 [Sinanodonta woodiana]|uniref:Uncharacterized protein n=1 Tax=Sinanodonta woodiana TaxID=1069815 RepID=A0ABD3WAH3_SINWO